VNTNTVARRSFLAAGAPAALATDGIDVALVETVRAAERKKLAEHPSSQANHSTTNRLVMAAIALEDAVLDFLDLTDVEVGFACCLKIDSDYALRAVGRLRQQFVHNTSVNGQVERCERALWRKLADRAERHEAEGGRSYLQTEGMYYDECRDKYPLLP
jgi:hypothetical protein